MTIAIHSFYILPVLYLMPFNILTFANTLIVIVLCFFIICCKAAIILYISKMHSQLDFTNEEHKKLIHGMHEGVLILRQFESNDDNTSKNIMFSNKTADDLLMTFSSH